MTQPQPAAAATGPMAQAARHLYGVVTGHKVQGSLEVRTEAWELPNALAFIAAAIRHRAESAVKADGIHSDWARAEMQLAATVDACAQFSRQLGPSFDALHGELIRRLLTPRPGEDKWDTTANQRVGR